MIRRLAHVTVATLTALSFAVTLFVSVLAQSHAASVSTVGATEPCVEHHQPQPRDFWTDACASLCDTSDDYVLVGLNSDRSKGQDQTANVVVYGILAPSWFVSEVSDRNVHSHDPPGSRLYLTTQRLRL